MNAAVVDIVLRFHRAVAPALDVLDEVYRSNGRSAGQNRLLLAIAPDGIDVRVLRSRLSLDSGYLSRLLRVLEREQLVTIAHSAADRRVRTVRLTGRGLREQARLVRDAHKAARSILEPLSATDRSRLIAAMTELNRVWDGTRLP